MEIIQKRSESYGQSADKFQGSIVANIGFI